jgi:hypothetical protein
MGHEPESDGANKIDPNTYYIEFWLHWIHDSNADLPKAQCIPSLFDSPSAGVALANINAGRHLTAREKCIRTL